MDTVIFDLNGTLVDSECAHWMAYRDVLSKYDIDFKFEEFSEDWTRCGRDLSYTLKKHGRQNLLLSVDDLKRQKDELFRTIISNHVVLMPGAAEAVARLSAEFALAVDSTSTKEDVVRLLRHFQIEKFFRIVGSSDMVWDSNKYGKNTKSSRFRYIADSLGCDPRRCVVVGDAEKDIRAAKDAGMAVIIVPTETTKDHDLSSSDLVLPSLASLTCEIVQEILSGLGKVSTAQSGACPSGLELDTMGI